MRFSLFCRAPAAATYLLSAAALSASMTATAAPADYADNLRMIQQSSVRNTHHDNSPYQFTPSDQLVIDNHLGPRSDYLNNPGGNPEQSFPVIQGGQFRVSCEFSHFAYDDPLVYPGEPGAAHLHMFFGNTHTNAFSTYDSLINSGSSTCNGQELNRSGYWAPAMFDADGNVRIPERVVIYYKGEGQANGLAQVYPPGAAMIPDKDINTVATSAGGARGKYSFVCSDQWSGASSPASNTVPDCDGDRFLKQYGVEDNPHVVLEMNVKFPICWNGRDPSDWSNFRIPDVGSWYYAECEGDINLPHLEYFINYRVNIGESTAGWYLASDVDPQTFQLDQPGGSTIHADWWGGWHPQINRMWIDNCVNYETSQPSGCGMGYLSDGGPNNQAPLPGPALKFRPQYTRADKVSAETLFNELCRTSRVYRQPADAAYCNPAGHDHGGGGDEMPTLTLGETDDGRYGHRYGSDRHPDSLMAMFDADGGEDLLLTLRAFDIDRSTEVGVYLNSDFIGNLSTGPNDQLNAGDTFVLPAAGLRAGTNRLEFRQRNQGWIWGVTALRIDPAAAAEITLTLGETDNGRYGHRYGDGRHPQSLTARFDVSGDAPLRLSVSAYDVDQSNEISVYLNDRFIANLSRGPNNALNAGDTIALPAARLRDGENRLRFRQRNAGWIWGVTQIRVEPAS